MPLLSSHCAVTHSMFQETKWTSGFWQRRWKWMRISWNLREQIPQIWPSLVHRVQAMPSSFTQVTFTRLPFGDNLNLTPCWSRTMDSPSFKFDVEHSGGCLVLNCWPESQRTWWHDEWRSSGKAPLPNSKGIADPVETRWLFWDRSQSLLTAFGEA